MSQSLLKGSYHLQHLFMIEDMIRCKRQNFWHFNLPHSKKKWLKDMRWMQSVFLHILGQILVGKEWFGVFWVDSQSGKCVPPRLSSIPGYRSAFLHVSEQILVSRECSAMICVNFRLSVECVPPCQFYIPWRNGWKTCDVCSSTYCIFLVNRMRFYFMSLHIFAKCKA